MPIVKGIAWGRDFAYRIRSEKFQVHSVFQRVCNLQAHPESSLLSLVNTAAALAPNALLVEGSSFRELCRAKEMVGFKSSILSSGEYQVDCRTLREIDPLPRVLPPEGGGGAGALQAVKSWFGMRVPGIGAEYSPLRQDLRKALLQEDLLLLGNVLGKLIGSGPGLTPAGDDFAAGVLLAYTRGMRIVKSRQGVFPEVESAQRFSADLVEVVKGFLPMTNAISRTMLDYAVQGEGARYVTAVVDGIYSKAADAVAAATELSRIGSSSGFYLLAGVLLGCEIYQQRFLDSLIIGGGLKR